VVSNAEVVVNDNATEKRRKEAKKAIKKLLRHLNIERVISSWFGHFPGGFGNSAQKLVIEIGRKVQQR